MTEQIIEILKISSLIIFNLFFLIMTIVGLISIKIALKANEMRQTFHNDYNEITNSIKSKVKNIDENAVEVVSSVTAGFINGIFRPKKKAVSTFGIAKKLISLILK
ncbi:hypothetical protein HC864_02090 [Candidatus Gracilibacteria bacterium]|nr:hypothetical protein [Candidatus Gracilibacteria bacterium]